MGDEAVNFFKACQIVLASLCYTYFFAAKIPKGIFRFFSLLPIFVIFTLLPLQVSRPIPAVILGGFITWIANFKLLLYSFNLGALSTIHPPISFLTFLSLAVFPITIKAKNVGHTHNHGSEVPNSETNPDVRNLTPDRETTDSAGEEIPKNVIPLNFWSKTLLFILLDVVYHHTKHMVVLCMLMYLFIDIAFGICELLVRATIGLELEPPSDEPYLSTSLQDFWGKRWNRVISGALRDTVYKPIRSTAEKIVGRKWARWAGVMAAFIVSGLMHELVYFYVTRVKPTWEVTWFFVLHGVCVILEMGVKRALGPKWKLHWIVSGPLTVGFVMGTGFWLFFPQILRNQVDTKATEDIINLGIYLKEMIKIL